MWVSSDYLQVVSEVKERNRFFKALNEIREIAELNSNENVPLEVREQFHLIVQKCDRVLKPIKRTNL